VDARASVRTIDCNTSPATHRFASVCRYEECGSGKKVRSASALTV
jgi:hypothetical protein